MHQTIIFPWFVLILLFGFLMVGFIFAFFAAALYRTFFPVTPLFHFGSLPRGFVPPAANSVVIVLLLGGALAFVGMFSLVTIRSSHMPPLPPPPMTAEYHPPQPPPGVPPVMPPREVPPGSAFSSSPVIPNPPQPVSSTTEPTPPVGEVAVVNPPVLQEPISPPKKPVEVPAKPSVSTQPAWITEWPDNNPGVLAMRTIEGFADTAHEHVFVVRTGQFATLAEAEAEFLRLIHPLGKKEIVACFGADAENWDFNSEALAAAVVQDRYTEIRAHDFGKFTAPMYRVYRLVNFEPGCIEQLRPAWKQRQRQLRLIILAAVWFDLTILAAGVWFAFRPRRRPIPDA